MSVPPLIQLLFRRRSKSIQVVGWLWLVFLFVSIFVTSCSGHIEMNTFTLGVFISSCTGTCWFLLLKITSTLRVQGEKILGSSFKLTPVTRTLPQFFFFFLNLQILDVHLSDTQVQLIRGSCLLLGDTSFGIYIIRPWE